MATRKPRKKTITVSGTLEVTQKPETEEASTEVEANEAPEIQVTEETAEVEEPVIVVVSDEASPFENLTKAEAVEAITQTIATYVNEEYTGHSRAKAVENVLVAYFNYESERVKAKAINNLAETIAAAQLEVTKAFSTAVQSQTSVFLELLGTQEKKNELITLEFSKDKCKRY